MEFKFLDIAMLLMFYLRGGWTVLLGFALFYIWLAWMLYDEVDLGGYFYDI
jgi:hypothetical protein